MPFLTQHNHDKIRTNIYVTEKIHIFTSTFHSFKTINFRSKNLRYGNYGPFHVCWFWVMWSHWKSQSNDLPQTRKYFVCEPYQFLCADNIFASLRDMKFIRAIYLAFILRYSQNCEVCYHIILLQIFRIIALLEFYHPNFSVKFLNPVSYLSVCLPIVSV